MRGPSFSLGALWDFSGVSNAGSGGREDVKTLLFGMSPREACLDPFVVVDILAILVENGKPVPMRRAVVLLMPIRKQDRRIDTIKWEAFIPLLLSCLCDWILTIIEVHFPKDENIEYDVARRHMRRSYLIGSNLCEGVT